MVAVPHCNPHPLKHTLNMILLLVGGGWVGGQPNNNKKRMVLKFPADAICSVALTDQR